jgi:Cupredoxin-like domain
MLELGKRAPIEEAFGLGRFAAILFAPLFLLAGAAIARAEEEPVFTIEFNDGTVSPLRIEVPANRRFQLQLRNNGVTPAEFESSELRKEKVLAPNSTSILVFRTLDPGEYAFFDDFHPDAPKAVLVAK